MRVRCAFSAIVAEFLFTFGGELHARAAQVSDATADTESNQLARPQFAPRAANTADAPLRGKVRPERRILLALQYAFRQAWARNRTPVSELSLPHGFTDPDNDAGLFVNTGLLLPHTGGQPVALAAQLTLEFEPWRLAVSPFVDVGAGGNIVLGRGSKREEAPKVEWLWSSTAGVGCKLYLTRLIGWPLNVRLLAQSMWVEPARVPLATVFSGWSVGAGVEYHWEMPELGLLRQLSHGEGMPEGW